MLEKLHHTFRKTHPCRSTNYQAICPMAALTTLRQGYVLSDLLGTLDLPALGLRGQGGGEG